jgi:uncharacterized lipoprotein YehR (DUF1307 family)
MKRYALLTSLVLASILLLTLAGCNKNDNSGSSNSGSANSGKSSSSSGSESKSSTASSRLVGTYVKEGDDPNDEKSSALRFTGDGKVYEGGKAGGEFQLGTYTVDGNTVTISGSDEAPKGLPKGQTSKATLESDNRLRWEGAAYIRK